MRGKLIEEPIKLSGIVTEIYRVHKKSTNGHPNQIEVKICYDSKKTGSATVFESALNMPYGTFERQIKGAKVTWHHSQYEDQVASPTGSEYTAESLVVRSGKLEGVVYSCFYGMGGKYPNLVGDVHYGNKKRKSRWQD